MSSQGHSNDRTHEGGLRVFRGNYDVRGPYTPEVVLAAGLTWHGVPLRWHDQELTWND